MAAFNEVYAGDCLDVLKTLPANSLDACVTDPPYHLTANKKGGSGAASVNLESPYGRARIGTGNGAGGFMGKSWDGGDIAFRPEVWREVLRVLKPGGHLLSFGGTRTYHRMACAIEDAGFEIRDCILYLYGSGFPKSHDVSKGIDRAAGAERKIAGVRRTGIARRSRNGGEIVGGECDEAQKRSPVTEPATDAARQWEGWGTALKPACEPICVARKPLSERTVAANVLRWGTGALNVDGCRVGTERREYSGGMGRFNDTAKAHGYRPFVNGTPSHTDKTFVAEGRWPANVIHDGSEEVVVQFPHQSGGGTPPRRNSDKFRNTYGEFKGDRGEGNGVGPTSGSAARFFYCAKANKKERNGSKHPTVKPLALMRYLIRLVTPPGGTVLDPFAGTGTTGEAAVHEGVQAILIEREPEYRADIKRRLKRAASTEQPHGLLQIPALDECGRRQKRGVGAYSAAGRKRVDGLGRP